MKSVLEIDRDSFQVKFNNKTVRFAPKEFDILTALIDAKGKVIARRDLIEKIWPKNRNNITNRTIDQHVSRLRKKTNKSVIVTVPTRGYRYVGA